MRRVKCDTTILYYITLALLSLPLVVFGLWLMVIGIMCAGC